MKKISIVLAILLVAVFALFAMSSAESDSTTGDQGKDTVQNAEADSNKDEADEKEETEVSAEDNASLGDYSVVIDSCRLSKDFEGKDVIIVKYVFSNVSSDDAASFMMTVNDNAYQDGVGLNESYFVDASANYLSDNQSKEIKKGATIDVEVAYVLNDTSTEVEIEVSEIFSFDDKVLTKTFTITG